MSLPLSAFPQRKNPRLPASAYALGGVCFVTICAQRRRLLFGEVVDGVMIPNAAGQMIDDVWCGLADAFPGVAVDAHQVMPNHFHGVLVVSAPGPSLPDVVHGFKAETTRRYASGVVRLGWPRFHGRLWQRGYYERVVRDDRGLETIRQYITANPARWAVDRENPEARRPLGA